MEARSLAESKEPLDIRRYKSVTECVLYIAFYKNEVASACHNCLKHVFQCYVTEVHSFFGMRLLTKELAGKEK